MNKLNLQEIRDYNKELKETKDSANKLIAERDFCNNELNNICSTLSTMLGKTVTIEMLQEVANERINIINTKLQLGKEILQRIKDKENQLNNEVTIDSPVINIADNSNSTINIEDNSSQGVHWSSIE